MLDPSIDLETIPSPSVTVVIVHHKDPSVLAECLAALRRTTYDNYSVVLVDNASEGSGLAELLAQYPDVRVERSGSNLGYAEGNNVALRRVTSQYVALLNDDAEVEPNWLTSLVEVMESDPRIGVCQPKLRSHGNPEAFDYAGAAGGMMDMFGYPFCRGRVFDHVEIDHGQYEEQVDIFWASGAACMYRVSALAVTGLFDPHFFAYAEEVDLCWRMHACGFRVVYTPRALVYHRGGATSNTNLARKMFWIHRNHLILVLKNYDFTQLLTLFPLRMLFDVASLLLYVQQGQFGCAWSIVRAHATLARTLPSVIRRRREAQRLYAQHQGERMPATVYRGALVVAYFLRGCKTYDMLAIKA